MFQCIHHFLFPLTSSAEFVNVSASMSMWRDNEEQIKLVITKTAARKHHLCPQEHLFSLSLAGCITTHAEDSATQMQDSERMKGG